MRRRWLACVAIVGAGLILAGLLAVFYLRGGLNLGKASDPSYVLITSPLNDAALFLGDPTYVRSSAMLTHRDYAGADLYVDDQKYALDPELLAFSPANHVTCTSEDTRFCGLAALSQLWMPATAGRHSLSVCLYGDPGAAEKWTLCSDKVSVVVTDLSAPPPSAGTYKPEAGDTVASVAEKFGLSSVLVAAANPGIDSAAPLSPDAPVTIPVDPSAVTPPSSPPTDASGGSPYLVSTVKMTSGLPIDKGYCYYSTGLDYWTRIPADPRAFAYPLDGALDLSGDFRTVSVPASGGMLAMECWGWSGSSLVPLGSGKTTYVPASSPSIHLQGDQFDLDIGLTVIPGKSEAMDKRPMIPPPFDLTGTMSVDVCIKHGPPDGFESLMWTWICKSATEKAVTTLVWEWSAPIFPVDDPKVSIVTKIDGFHVYEVLPGGKPTLIKTIKDPRQRALDLSFLKGMLFLKGPPTFFVRAVASGLESADSNHYTLRSEAPGLATVTLDPSIARYGGAEKHRTTGLFCSTGTGTEIVGSPDIGGDDVAVGYVHHLNPTECLESSREYTRAQVIFDLSPVKGPVDSAELTYQEDFTSAPGQSCASRLGITTTTTAGAAYGDMAFEPYALLPTAAYPGTTFIWTVTDAVRDWQGGKPNAGFLFIGRNESLDLPDCGLTKGCIEDHESCWSAYGKLQLTVTYFAP